MRPLSIVVAMLLTPLVQAAPLVHEGDHIAIVGNTFADQLRIHGYLETRLQQSRDISMRNLGWGGDTLTVRDRPTGFPSEESTLKAHETDLIIACFGMGESFDGEAGLAAFKNDLTAFIVSHQGKAYNAECAVRLVLVSPIAYEYLGSTTPAVTERNRELEAYTAAMKEVADEVEVPFIDLFEPTRRMMKDAGTTRLTTNGIHLNPYGYWAVSRVLAEALLGESVTPWKITLDPNAAEGSAEGVRLGKVSREKRDLVFAVTEPSGASLAPPEGIEIPASLAPQKDLLVVPNLDPGEYTLMIDDVKITTANHAEWAEGVAIENSPAHQEAEALRTAINDKNLQFLYSWKALNQVHIVGERKRSPSGKALPAEQVEFNELAKKREQDIREASGTKTRIWRLIAKGL
ncbi:SGNH/GDSL hydrolase family protein [Haloferula chungangensis]|uniref:SGNH/GDSL hydrolase family protein n=1 Tax=Haloferula chungangensis TaxID=1048331 RepID=A0ABW2L9H7_9BACT